MSNYIVQWASGGTQSIPGKTSIILNDGETDSSDTSLTLTGRDVTTYGQIQQTNFVQLLENSASHFSPTNPTIGQLWYKSNGALAGQIYKCIAPAGASAQPANSFNTSCIHGTTSQGADGSWWAPVSYLYTPLNATGDTMSGSLNMGGHLITNMNMAASPSANDAVTVGYMTSQIVAIIGGSVVNTYTAGTGLALSTHSVFSNTGLLSATGGQNITVTPGQNPVISLTGIVPVASVAAQASAVNVTSNNVNTLYPVSFASIASGIANILTSPQLNFNPGTGQLVAPSFVGSLTGNAQTSTVSTTANNLGGGGIGYLPYQSSAGVTSMLTPGQAGQVLTLSGGVPTWHTITQAGSTVASFNTRSGAVTLTYTDVTSALGYTPANNGNVVYAFNGRGGNVTLSYGDVSSALGYTPQPSLGFTPVQQGGGTGQGTNKIYQGWSSSGQLLLQVDLTNFGSTWPINIGGTAATANNANYASTAGNGGVTSVNGATGAVSLPIMNVVSQSLGLNGFCQLSTGLMFQWGYAAHSGGSGSVLSHSFTTPFPSACFNVQLTIEGWTPLGGDNGPLTAANVGTSTFNTYSTNDPGAVNFFWFAVGI